MRRLRRPALAFCLVMASCGDDGTGPGLSPEATITPDQPVSLYVGDSLTVQATIRNSRHPGVTYSSSAPEIVQIDRETGLATAVATGTATIFGISQIDPRVFAQTEFTVLPDLPASMGAPSLKAAGGADLDPGRVSGRVVASYRVQTGNAVRLEVHLGERAVCTEALAHVAGAPAPAAADFVCEFDTAAFDRETARPWFQNGESILSARLVAAGERTLADSPEMVLTLRNPPRLVSEVTGERTAVDSSGEEWLGGDLSVDVTPVLYEPGISVASVTLRYEAPGGADTAATVSSAPYRFTLSAGGVLADATDPELSVSLASELEGGADGPSSDSRPLRYDGAPPQPGVLIARDWIGAETRFVDTYSTEGESDAGVGRIHLRFYAGDPALSAAEIAAGGEPIETGADLEQRGAGSYELAAEVCDGLENCKLVGGYEFGVDLTPPLVEAVSLADRRANPGTNLVVGVRDDLSGFPDRMLEVTAQHLDNSPGTASCGPIVDGVDLPGRPLAGGCAPDTLGNPVPVPRTTAGYYHYSLVAFDRAGNRSTSVARSLLVDLEAPTAGVIELEGPLVPGENFTATIEAGDDVELAWVDFRQVYPSPSAAGSVALPLAGATPIGVPFDESLTPSATASGTLPFVRTLTFASDGAAPRPTVLVDSIRATAYDAAGLTASSRLRIPPELYGGDVSTADPFPRYGIAEVLVDRSSVCSGGCSAEDPTSLRISTRIEGESGTGRPFARIHFYRQDSGGVLTHIGLLEGTEATITNAGNRSTYLYTLEHEPSAGLSGDFGIVAVGVNSRGNALATSLASAPVVNFYRR